MSLSLSVAVVIIGILCTQWIREYERETSLDPQDSIALRHIRYEGLLWWKVPSILRALPVMLHGSLVLFFVGLVDLLWSLNHIVALSVSVISGLVFLLIVATTFLPTLQLFAVRDRYLRVPQCAFKSAQSWLAHRVVSFVIRCVAPPHTLLNINPRWTTVRERYNEFAADRGWEEYDMKWRKIRGKAQKTGGDTEHTQSDLVAGLVWIEEHLGQSVEAICSVYHCLKDFKSVAQTKQALFRIKGKISTYLHTAEMTEYLKTIPDDEQKEIMSALFLEMHDRAFPQLDQYQVESVVRILNTHLTKKGKDDSPISWSFYRWPFDSISGMPEDLVTQVLLCTRDLVRRKMADNFKDDIWNLIRGIILTDRPDNLEYQTLHRKISFEIIRAHVENAEPTELVQWITRVVKTLFPGIQTEDEPEMGTLMAFIAGRVQTLGGPSLFSNPNERICWQKFQQMKSSLIPRTGDVQVAEEADGNASL